MTTRKPQPLYDRRKPERCPVCNETSYSLAGIHPQCAVRQADEVRMNRLKLARVPQIEQSVWQKNCPRCQLLRHARKAVCECGHTFSKTEKNNAMEGKST